MMSITPKRIHNPIPPEYANVFTLKAITLTVGIVCLLLTAYVTWVVYTMSNRIAVYQNPLEVEAVVRRIAPINFTIFERIIAIDEEKRTFKLPPIPRDAFYNRVVSSTENIANELPPLPQTSPSSSTHL